MMSIDSVMRPIYLAIIFAVFILNIVRSVPTDGDKTLQLVQIVSFSVFFYLLLFKHAKKNLRLYVISPRPLPLLLAEFKKDFRDKISTGQS